jgi:hypothetical protein
MSARNLRWAVAILAVLIAGKSLLFLAAGQPPLFRDSLGYWQLGAQMAGGDWLLLRDPQVFRTPGYPAFLAVCMALFGEWALVAATVLQQLAIVAVALLTAWICWRITGSQAAAAIGLALSLLCVARSYIGLYLLSDNLTCLLLTAFFASFVAWFHRPSLGWAAAMGLLLGLSILTRPVMQLAWAPVLLAMWLHLRKQGDCPNFRPGDCPNFRPSENGTVPFSATPDTKTGTVPVGRRFVKHALCLLAVAALPVVPWLARNAYCFDRPFLTRSIGRQLWDSCFLGEPDGRWLNPTLEFAADAPTTARMFRELQGHDVPMRDYSAVYQALRDLKYSESEAEELMAGVSREAIREHAARFAVSRSYKCLLFWITSEEVFCWQYDNIERDESGRIVGGEVATGFTLGEREPPATYEDQETWCCPPAADALDALLQWTWYPSRLMYGLAALATLWGAIGMIRDPRLRSPGIALALLLLYFTAVTAIPARPMYRYRMILEPLMIVAVTAGLRSVMERVAPTPTGKQ